MPHATRANRSHRCINMIALFSRSFFASITVPKPKIESNTWTPSSEAAKILSESPLNVKGCLQESRTVPFRDRPMFVQSDEMHRDETEMMHNHVCMLVLALA